MYYALNKKRKELKLEKKDVENFVLWAIIGVVVGSRLFMLFWEPVYYLSNPLRILMVWKGGMSLHGGILGIATAGYFFVKRGLTSWNNLRYFKKKALTCGAITKKVSAYIALVLNHLMI